MKNNSMAMLALISLVVALASLIGYVDPATCPIQNSQGWATCEQAAAQHLWIFWIFGGFGVLTFAGSFLIRKFKKAA